MKVTLHHFIDDELAAGRLANALGVPALPIRAHQFPDGESLPTVATPGEMAILYRSLAQPGGKLFPLALAADALRRLGARQVLLVAPNRTRAGQLCDVADAHLAEANNSVAVRHQPPIVHDQRIECGVAAEVEIA